MRREMGEQPEVLARLLSRRVEVDAGDVAGVVIVARGSSDHAAVYGRYLLELATRRPVALAAPSLLHPLRRPDRRERAGSWSASASRARRPRSSTWSSACGRRAARRSRSPTIRDSPLAAASEAVIELGAGEERAVPATKTFTAQMAAFAVLAAALGDVPWADGELALVPDAVAAVLADPEPVEALSRALGGHRGARRDRARVALLRGAGVGAEGP